MKINLGRYNVILASDEEARPESDSGVADAPQNDELRNSCYIVLVLVVITFAFLSRSYNLTAPLFDTHYFRQTQTATVARNFAKDGVDVFHTRLDILGTGKEQVLLLEFPFYQAVVAFLASFLGFSDSLGRLVSIFFGATGSVVLMLLVNSIFRNKLLGFSALVFFLFFPLNIYYLQTFMIESTVVALHIFSLYSWFKFTDKQDRKWLGLSTLFTTLSLLQKIIYAPFLILSILALLYSSLGKKRFFQLRWLAGLLIATVLAIIWQLYVDITNQANGHAFYTFGNKAQQVWNFGVLADRFSQTLWRERLSVIQNSITKFSIFPFLVGLFIVFKKPVKRRLFWLNWLLSMLLYYLLFFRIQSHDYYFMPVLPVVSVIASLGLYYVARFVFSKSNLFALFIFGFLTLFVIKAVANAKPYFNLDLSTYQKLKIINSGLKAEGYVLFVFPEYNWNSVYTYYTRRRGVALGSKDVTEEKILALSSSGYSYIIFDGYSKIIDINPDIVGLTAGYPLVVDKENIRILKLKQ